jgi:hypothetical protein
MKNPCTNYLLFSGDEGSLVAVREMIASDQSPLDLERLIAVPGELDESRRADWCRSFWGTPSNVDAATVSVEQPQPGVLLYQFDSEDTPALSIVSVLADALPQLAIALTYHRPHKPLAGRCRYRDGEQVAAIEHTSQRDIQGLLQTARNPEGTVEQVTAAAQRTTLAHNVEHLLARLRCLCDQFEMEYGTLDRRAQERYELERAAQTTSPGTPQHTNYLVVGIYADNNQRYGEEFHAISRQDAEAQAHAATEAELLIAAVIDTATYTFVDLDLEADESAGETD